MSHSNNNDPLIEKDVEMWGKQKDMIRGKTKRDASIVEASLYTS